MDDKPTNPGSDAAKDDDLIAAARQQAEAWTPPGSETETTPAAGGGEVPVRFRDLPSDSFPGFEIVKEVHRGGQGVVYQAVQKATKRRVAIKVMHEGPFAGPRDKARFEREVQILAALKHPNIVAIHDSGTAAGHFFYVMDYISGLPLDQYTASGERSIEETLKLFGKICEAVNAAHLKGVIHRDLKPGNIRIDSKGEPHVLDFGLAKVAMGDMTNDSRPAVMSMTGQFIGSLPWASPEQAEAVPDKIDIRTDVYSLGVILYQMLTGKFPYEVVGNMRDVLDRILKAEPTKPSTIRRQINDEVETIVLKCLQKERERRYQSAGDVGRDIGRYLAGEPIEAKRDSAMYVLRKQLRRYRVPAAVAATFVILLSASTVALSVMYRNQSRERERAEHQTQIAQDESQRADRLAAEASKQAALVQEANDDALFLGDSIAQRLYMQGDYAGAELVYHDLVNIRQLLLGKDHPDVARSLSKLANVLYAKGDSSSAEPIFRQSLAIFRGVPQGEDHQRVLCLRNLGRLLYDKAEYAEAEGLFRESMAIQATLQDARVAPGLPHIDEARAALGRTLAKLGRFGEAESLLLGAQQFSVSRPAVPVGVQQDVFGALETLYATWHSAAADRGYDAKAAEWGARKSELAGFSAGTKPAKDAAPAGGEPDLPRTGRIP